MARNTVLDRQAGHHETAPGAWLPRSSVRPPADEWEALLPNPTEEWPQISTPWDWDYLRGPGWELRQERLAWEELWAEWGANLEAD